MKFEHLALNVPDVHAAIAWYGEHLGLKIVRAQPVAPFMTFLADETGRTVLELYTNPVATVPDYPGQHAVVLHLGFAVKDAAAERSRLEAAGARFDSETLLGDGSRLIMMRDPWGVALQLCQRTQALP